MSNNTKIFSEAIAEAKAIRETAMANAKLALEEAFAPRIQEMMSNKLEALAEDDVNEDIGQAIADAGMDDGMDAGMDVTNEEISLEELLAELDGLEEYGDEHAVSTKSALGDDEEKMEENTIAEAEDDDEVGTISVKDLKDMFREVMADIMGGGEEEEAGEEEMEAGEEEMEAGEDDLELEEILAEIANLEEGDLEEGIGSAIKGAASKVAKGAERAYDAIANAKPLPGLDKFDRSIDRGSARLTKIGKDTGIYDKSDAAVQKAIDAKQRVMGKSPLGAGHSVTNEAEVEEAVGGVGASNPETNTAIIAINKLADQIAKATGKTVDTVKAKLMSLMNEELEETTELQEAMSTIATLRSELNEVNLLNAKLLYVNKLFKAKNLNEAQKVKVINAFDRAETVREAKNVFDTLNESLNTEKAKSQIKESLSFASKSAGVSDRQPIMEGNDFVARMQKLAGII
jgi:hypothetical protein